MQSALEDELGFMQFSGAGIDAPDSVKAAYFERSFELASKGYSTETPQQFFDGLLESTESKLGVLEAYALDMVNTDKEELLVNPSAAINNAVNAAYTLKLVGTVRSQIGFLKNGMPPPGVLPEIEDTIPPPGVLPEQDGLTDRYDTVEVIPL